MPNNKISGEYIIQSIETIDEYTFTGENRTATVEKTENKRLGWIDLSNGSIQDRALDFQSKNKLRINSIRIITPGAAGLRCVNTDNVIRFAFFNTSEEVVKIKDAPIIEISEYNEWQKCDVVLEPYLYTKLQYYTIGLRQWKFNIDDYNIQDDYIGQKLKFKIQMSIKTAGIFRDGGII